MSVVAIVPAFDEADRIVATVTAARGIEGVDRVLVVDDASSDATAGLAAAAGADVLRLERNGGKGAALEAGIDAATDADVVLLLDGDLGETAAQGVRLLAPVLAGRADMTVAVFPRTGKKAGFGLVKGLARRGIARLGHGFAAAEPLSGQRALSRRAVEVARPLAWGYGVEVAMTVRVLRAGMRILEVECAMSHAATGRDAAGFAHRGRQFLHVLRALARLAVEPPPR